VVERQAIPYKPINARAETLSEKPSFRSAFKSPRCLIPASGFYEWEKTSSHQKQPYFIRPRDGGLFAFAGLWELWQAPEGEPVETCTILTTEANELMRSWHDRMPVILDTDGVKVWLHTRSAVDALLSVRAVRQRGDGSVSGESVCEQSEARGTTVPGACLIVSHRRLVLYREGAQPCGRPCGQTKVKIPARPFPVASRFSQHSLCR
jgi:putative SOS response-associated peptidase YedK